MSFNVIIIDGQKNSNSSLRLPDENIFFDRRKNSNGLLIILAGYKPFLFEDVFDRVETFAPGELDVCVVSSGLFDETLAHIAEKNNWSYLSTVQNNVPLVQNLALSLHEGAEFVYKMDEDIFLTEGSFETLLKTYEHVQTRGHYNVGFVAPLIPINGYGHIRLLEKLGLLETYEKTFEPVLYGAHSNRMIEKSPEVAKFFWGEGGTIPSIDRMNAAFRIQKMSYSICPVRFSIGFILFRREFWQLMGGWQLPSSDNAGVGLDEAQICNFCMAYSFGIVIAENAVVGHLSFGQQNEAMKEYYLNHREKFHRPH